MNKFLKYGLLGVGGIVLLAGGVAAYLAATFNPNDYKAQIIQLVKEKKQRTLKLEGDFKLTFFPSIGASLGKVSLSEFQGEKEFASIDGAHVALALMPLFSKQVVVDEVSLSGVRANLIKFKNGTSNIDDLLSNDESKSKAESSQVKFDIASVKIEKAELSYRNESSGAQYALKDLNLHTGRIASSVPSKIDFSAQIQANQPRLDIATQLKTTLTFDLEKKLYRVEGLDFQVKGAALGISNLLVQASGDASINMGTLEYSAKKFALSASGVKDKDSFNAKLDVPALSLNKEKFSGEMLTLDIDMKQADASVPVQTLKVKLSSLLSGNVASQQFNLSNLLIAVSASGDKLPNKSVSSEIKGNVQIDALKKNVQANLAGGLLQSQIKAKVAVNGFAEPAIRFDVDVDQFDADLYMPKKAASGTAKHDTAAAEQPLDLSALKKLNLEGSLRIGTLKVSNIKSSQLRLDMKAHNGQLNVSPLSANLYQGSMTGSIAVNAAQATPSFAIKQNLIGINIAPLLKDAADFDTLEGKGNVAMNLTTQGNTVSALKKGLNGSLGLNLADGAIKGINIARKVRDAKALFAKGGASAQTESANKDEKTDFSEMKASFKISNGVAHNDDLSLKSPLLRLSGAGDIDIGNDSINYLAKATLAGTLEGQGGKESVGGLTVPVRVSGPFAGIKYTLDFGAMVSDVAKQKIEAKKEEIKGKLQDQLKEGLKGLFK